MNEHTKFEANDFVYFKSIFMPLFYAQFFIILLFILMRLKRMIKRLHIKLHLKLLLKNLKIRIQNSSKRICTAFWITVDNLSTIFANPANIDLKF